MVLLRLVFLVKEYSSEVFQALLAVPHFSKVTGKEPKAEAVIWRCSVKKDFLEISHNSQENTCALIFHLEFVRNMTD